MKFERYVIFSAIKEINEKANYIVEFKKVLNYELTWIQKEKPVSTKNKKTSFSFWFTKRKSKTTKYYINNKLIIC